mmetsp:Transcript_36174/g.104098  ORF Transcript_36174/g.104098 Transcript_36174/m.104098 type:complete len:283 (+) Transcript_36174:53-901(+)
MRMPSPMRTNPVSASSNASLRDFLRRQGSSALYMFLPDQGLAMQVSLVVRPAVAGLLAAAKLFDLVHRAGEEGHLVLREEHARPLAVPVEVWGLRLEPLAQPQGRLAARPGEVLLLLGDLGLKNFLAQDMWIKKGHRILWHLEGAHSGGLPPWSALGRRLRLRDARSGQGSSLLWQFRDDEYGSWLRLRGRSVEKLEARLLIPEYVPELLLQVQALGPAVDQVLLLGDGFNHPWLRVAVTATLAGVPHATMGAPRAPKEALRRECHGLPSVPSPPPAHPACL